MPKQEFENEFHRLTNLLVSRGFARSTSYDSARSVAFVEWTTDGEALQSLLRQLFDIPNVGVFDLADRHIADFVVVVLSATPLNPIR